MLDMSVVITSRSRSSWPRAAEQPTPSKTVILRRQNIYLCASALPFEVESGSVRPQLIEQRRRLLADLDRLQRPSVCHPPELWRHRLRAIEPFRLATCLGMGDAGEHQPRHAALEDAPCGTAGA